MPGASTTEARARAAAALAAAGIVLTAAERAGIELAGFGLGAFEREGLALLVYVNTDRYCAKELVLLPGQACPEHRHPPCAGGPGKRETFRCRTGEVHLAVAGIGAADGLLPPPPQSAEHYTVSTGVVLHPGEQLTIPPDTLHWFRAGPDGAVISEFSSTSHDEADVFTDPRVRRLETS